MEPKRLSLPAWNPSQDRPFLPSLICSSCSSGIALMLTGGVLVAVFRNGPYLTNFALGGMAILVLGSTFFGVGVAMAAFTVYTRQRLPKTSSAANADVPPDPYCLVPVYPANCEMQAKSGSLSETQILILPGGFEPVSGFGQTA